MLKVILNFACFRFDGCFSDRVLEIQILARAHSGYTQQFRQLMFVRNHLSLSFSCRYLGPLNNMKESMIQFSKPRKLVNKSNPVRIIPHMHIFLSGYEYDL